MGGGVTSLHEPGMTGDVEDLAPELCWQLLAGERIGRIAVDSGGGPLIFPVNHIAHDGRIYFRSGGGTKAESVWAHPRVAFEVDGRDQHGFWSVVADGPAELITEGQEARQAGIDQLVSLYPSRKTMVVRVTPDRISGRRFSASAVRSALWGE